MSESTSTLAGVTFLKQRPPASVRFFFHGHGHLCPSADTSTTNGHSKHTKSCSLQSVRAEQAASRGAFLSGRLRLFSRAGAARVHHDGGDSSFIVSLSVNCFFVPFCFILLIQKADSTPCMNVWHLLRGSRGPAPRSVVLLGGVRMRLVRTAVAVRMST